VAISNSRLRALDPHARTVSFTYKDYADGQRLKTLVLPAPEFLRRFLFHVLPRGFTKIRHYGLLGNNRRRRQVTLARSALEASPLRFQPKLTRPCTPAAPLLCPHCQSPEVRCLARINASGVWTFFAPTVPLARRVVYLDSS